MDDTDPKYKKKRWHDGRNYPVSEIDEGIRRSLKASLDWLDSAYLLLRLGKKTQGFIYYTFAVEEFGKAILLNERKKSAKSKGEKIICDDDITFRVHDAKIKKAEEVLQDPATKIRLIDESKILAFVPNPQPSDDENTYMEFKDVREFPYRGNFLSFDNRMSLMYVDYDEDKKKWKDIEELPFDFSMEVGFDAFKREVQAWQSDFEKGLK